MELNLTDGVIQPKREPRPGAEWSGFGASGLDAAVEGSPVAEDARLQAKLIQVERDATAVAYRNDAMTDDSHRPIERELDLEDVRNLHTLESATGSRLADPESEIEG